MPIVSVAQPDQRWPRHWYCRRPPPAPIVTAACLQEPTADPVIATHSQARLLPPQSPEEGGGSVLLPGLVPTGAPLGQPSDDNLQPSAAACCAACRANPECTAFSYCNREVNDTVRELEGVLGMCWQHAPCNLATR